MKNLNEVYFCFLSLLLLSSCIHFQMKHLSEEDRLWIENVEKLDTVWMKSNEGKRAFIIYSKVRIYDKHNPFYITSRGPEPVFEACGKYNFDVQTDEGRTFDGFFYIYSIRGHKTPHVKLYFDKMKSQGIEKGHDREMLIPLKTEIFKVSGYNLNDCIVAHRKDMVTNYPNEALSKQPNLVVISKKYGLVYFSYDNGLSYSIDFSTFDSDNP